MAKYFSLYRSRRSCIAPELQAWPSTGSLAPLLFFVGARFGAKTCDGGGGVDGCTTIDVEEAPPSPSLNSPSILGSPCKAIASEWRRWRRWRKWYMFCLCISVLELAPNMVAAK
ncbi:hypothetical protein KC19_VG304300 [Ceratodon purpureus]|uniref:Uncharacterized protein n=1 Tax=Ceratodon purpureus TaxID=3225 RepID=A0A8T0HV42_CERPU|nr:hypothetical protein KC19_VG304300 [Ceratodon purpureus]